MNRSSLIIPISFLLIILTFPTFAQGAPPATPIDGGLSILLVAGALYATRQLTKKKQRPDAS